jgi:hypothetical protein
MLPERKNARGIREDSKTHSDSEQVWTRTCPFWGSPFTSASFFFLLASSAAIFSSKSVELAVVGLLACVLGAAVFALVKRGGCEGSVKR